MSKCLDVRVGVLASPFQLSGDMKLPGTHRTAQPARGVKAVDALDHKC
jgi:hypothetical protein